MQDRSEGLKMTAIQQMKTHSHVHILTTSELNPTDRDKYAHQKLKHFFCAIKKVHLPKCFGQMWLRRS